jgi:hypothetical protein
MGGLRFGIDLDRKGIFSPNCLIYTIRDEHGSPIAFSARNLKYEEEKVVYEKKYNEIEARTDLNKDEKTAEIKKLWEPRKCINSAETILFQKRCVLFNFNQAKKSSHKTIQVFEGNADAVTIFAGGIKTAVATCGTAFTQEHLEMVLAVGITKIILVFDPDKGGKEGTLRFVKMLEEFGSHPGLEVEIIVMPGTSDPDAYVRAFGDLRTGVSEFRKLVRTDLFTWKLRKEVEEGGDPYEIVNRTLPLIVNVPNNMTRLAMADRLAEATGLVREFVQRELLRLLDTNEMKVDEELAAIAQQTIKALQQNPKAMEAILATAATRRDAILESKVGYDAQANLKAFEVTIEKMEGATDMFELVTGYQIFDSLMGGVPKEGALFTLPGKPFHGKSILIDNFIVNMLRLNPNLQIMLHHVDDAALLRVPRILGIMSKLSSRAISKAGTSRAGTFGEEFDERYTKAVAELRGWITDERLILADQARLTGSLPAHERWIKEIRRRNSHGSFVSIGDNFHLFDMPGMEPGEGKVREMSKFISGLPTKHGITTMFTMELPKDILKPGNRPKYTDSKNSGGIAFDSKVNMNVYQELQDLGDESSLVWRSPNYMEETVDPSGATAMSEKVLPIIEAIIDKNKVTGLVKTIYYRLEPFSGVLEECSLIEQITLQTTLDAARKERKAANKTSFTDNPGSSNRGSVKGPLTRGQQYLMSTYLVYLSGPIAGLTYAEGAEWREYVTRCFPPHIQGISPLRAKRYLNDGTVITGNQPPKFPLSTDRAINTCGRFDTLRSDAILVNLLGTSTVSIGPVMEIAWAYGHNIPVVVAIEPEGNPHDHPMLRDCISARVASLDEAIEIVTAIVSPHESKIWTRIEQNHMLRDEGRLDLRQEVLKESHGGSTRTH